MPTPILTVTLIGTQVALARHARRYACGGENQGNAARKPRAKVVSF
jgi:hypothetical protein